MKWRIIKISNLILALLLVAFTIGYTYAWFADYYSVDIKLYVDSGDGYFKSGDGSETKPYVISSYRHLYNLAWLQNTGKFSSTEATYFELEDDIDMNGYVIPPIGNDDNPFIGVFDGNGYTISNLIVSTDKNKLTNFPVESASGYEFSNYVGLFGKTDGSSNIKNFILDDPIVEVEDPASLTADTNYNEVSSTTSYKCCGLAIGYVAYKASSIGVIGGTLAVQRTGYTTYNSILGSISDDVEVSVTGSSGGDTGYFIPETLANGSKKTISGNTWIVADSSNSLGLGSFSFLNGKDASDIEKSEISSFTYLSTTKETTSTDYNGNNNTNNIITGINCFTRSDNDTTINLNATYTSGTNQEEIQSKVVDKTGTQMTSLSYLLNMQNSPAKYDTTAGTEYNVIKESQYKTGNISSDEFSSAMYSAYNGQIKVKITSSSTKIFVIASHRLGKNESRYLGVYKMSDNVGSYNKFEVGSSSSYKESTDFEKTEPIMALELTGDSGIYACEFSFTNTGAGVYGINSTNGGINIYYLAVVGVESGDIPLADEKYDVSAIDFIYSGVSITQNETKDSSSEETIAAYNFIYTEGTSISFYQPTGTKIWLNVDASTATNAVLIIAYTRSSDENDKDGYYGSSKTYTIHINYYNGTDTPTGSDDSVVDTSNVTFDANYFEKYYKLLKNYYPSVYS